MARSALLIVSLLCLVALAGCTVPVPSDPAASSAAPAGSGSTPGGASGAPVASKSSSAAPASSKAAVPSAAVTPPPSAKPGKAPAITSAFAADVTNTAATIAWMVTGSGPMESYVLYGHGPTNLTTQSTHQFGAGPHAVGLDSLVGTYYYVIVATNPYGAIQSGVLGFTTAPTPGNSGRGETDPGAMPTSSEDAEDVAAAVNPCGTKVPQPDYDPLVVPTPFKPLGGYNFGYCPNMTVYWSSTSPSTFEIYLFCFGTSKVTAHLDWGTAPITTPSTTPADTQTTFTTTAKLCAHWTLTGLGAMSTVYFMITIYDISGASALSPQLTGRTATVLGSGIILCRDTSCGGPPPLPYNPSSLPAVKSLSHWRFSFKNNDIEAHILEVADSSTGSIVATGPNIPPGGTGVVDSGLQGFAVGTYDVQLQDEPTAFESISVTAS